MRFKIFDPLKEHFFIVLVLIITLVIYFKIFSYGYISWDDPEMIFKNSAVKNFDLRFLFSNHFVGNYIPITMLLHALSYKLFGSWIGGFHLLSLLFHLLNGILVYQLIQQLFKNKFTSHLATIIFLLHPFQIESVVWISEFKTVLSASFFLLSITFYFQFIQSKNQKKYLLSFLFFIFASLSKPSILMLPLVLVALDWFQNKKISIIHQLNKIPFLIVSLIIAYVTFQSQKADQFINYSHSFSFIYKIGFAGFALIKYIILFFLPFGLSVIYPFPNKDISVLIIGLLLILALLFCIYILWRKNLRNYAFSILFFILNLILVLQFVPFGECLNADRYMYLALIGLALIISFVLNKFNLNNKPVLIFFLLFNSIFSFARISVWKNSLSLYEDVIQKYPNEFVALNSAGVECMFQNKNQEAYDYLKRAIAVSPNNYKGYYNLGLLYIKNNQAKFAIESLNSCIQMKAYYKAYIARAAAYYMLGDFSKAINDANQTIALDKNSSKAHFILGNCYNDLNHLNEAISEYNKAIEKKLDDGGYYFKRAIAFGKQQKFEMSLSDLIVSLNLSPQNHEAHYWKGVALYNLKRNPCEDFKIAAQNNFEPAVDAFNKYCR